MGGGGEQLKKPGAWETLDMLRKIFTFWPEGSQEVITLAGPLGQKEFNHRTQRCYSALQMDVDPNFCIE